MFGRTHRASLPLLIALGASAFPPFAWGQDSAPAPAAAATPPSERLESTTIGIPPALARGVEAGERLSTALRTALGNAQVEWLPNPPSVIVRGTRDQIHDAFQVIADWEAQAAARQQQLDSARAAEAERVTGGSGTIAVFEFPGGTIADYLAYIESITGERKVVVLDAETLAVPMPSVRLTGVQAEAAIKLLSHVPTPSGRSVTLNTISTQDQTNGAQSRFFVAFSLPAGADRGPPRVERSEVRVWDLSNVNNDSDPKALDALLEAVGVGLELAGHQDDFATKLHPASGLFFARGSGRDLAMVDAVIMEKYPGLAAVKDSFAAPRGAVVPPPSAAPTNPPR